MGNDIGEGIQRSASRTNSENEFRELIWRMNFGNEFKKLISGIHLGNKDRETIFWKKFHGMRSYQEAEG